jgi:protease I
MAALRAVIITAAGFQDEELIYPYYRLQEAGFDVEVAVRDRAAVHGKYGLPARPTMDTRDLRAQDFDVVVLPGGHEAPDRVRQDRDVLAFVRDMDRGGKVVAAICHGPWILISAGVVRGRRATCYAGMADDLENAGAVYQEAPVMEDRNLITSPHYRNNPDFMKAILQRFDGRSESNVHAST